MMKFTVPVNSAAAEKKVDKSLGNNYFEENSPPVPPLLQIEGETRKVTTNYLAKTLEFHTITISKTT